MDMSFKGTVVALLAGFVVLQVPDWGLAAAQGSQDEFSPSICSEILEIYKNKKLSEIQVGFLPSYPDKGDQFFWADIDNDGHDEKLKYFPTRRYAYVAEVIGDKVIGLPQSSEGNINYNGNIIIKYNNKYLQMHFTDGPYEIQELTRKEIGPDEDIRPLYNVKTLCNYHESTEPAQ